MYYISQGTLSTEPGETQKTKQNKNFNKYNVEVNSYLWIHLLKHKKTENPNFILRDQSENSKFFTTKIKAV